MLRKPKKTRRYIDLRPGQRVDVVGESHYQQELDRICGGRSENGHQLPVFAVLLPEADNPHDADAVAVWIEKFQVGHLDRETARIYRPLLESMASEGQLARCVARVVGGWDRGVNDRGHYGVRLDLAPPESAHPSSPPPPPSITRRGSHTGASSSHRLEVGFVDGRHFTDWVDPVKQMKRDKRYEEVLRLLYRLCESAEAESVATGQTLPPWYFEQVAIEESRAGRPDRVVAILERYANSPLAVPGQFDERLGKALRKFPAPPA